MLGFSASGGPTYKKQAFNAISFQGVKPNKSIRRVFVQALIIENS
jgi:hypothetical protein